MSGLDGRREAALKRLAVLGGGMVGGFMARRLAQAGSFDVLLCDRDSRALARAAAVPALKTRQTDLSDPNLVRQVVSEVDLVLGAAPGRLGFRVVEAVLDAGKNIVDISFFPEDAFELDALARRRGVTAVVDCGVMPGLGGMLGLHLAAQLDRADRLTILVGGLPVERRWPLEYMAPFSPSDVIEEYTRPARMRKNGALVVRPALSEPELVDFAGVGTLEAFNTDGLRTLLRTCEIPDMQEKTLRYPGHAERMRLLRDLGFFSTEAIDVDHQKVRPIDVAARLLLSAWRLEPGAPELTVMRVDVEGLKAGRREIRRCSVFDRTDPETGDSSMARTTGYPALIVARLMAEGTTLPPGVLPAETLALQPLVLDAVRSGLVKAGVSLTFETLPGPAVP